MRKTVTFIITLIIFFQVTDLRCQNLKDGIAIQIDKDSLLILSKGKYFVESILKNDSMLGFVSVTTAAALDSAKRFIIELEVNRGMDMDDLPTILKIYNPFDKKIFYKVKTKSKKNGTQFHHEAVLPLNAKAYTAAIWPYTVEAVKLYDLQFKK